MTAPDPRPAVVYLARGADTDPLARFERFAASYRRFPAGEDHALHIIFKGFAGDADLAAARQVFAGLHYETIHTQDEGFDLGAYRDASRLLKADRVCFFNTNSELLTANWLAKLSANFALPHVGLVGATGSFESLHRLDTDFPRFPNVHLRSNAFMIRRETFLEAIDGIRLNTKFDAWMFESGPSGLTQRIVQRGRSVLIVGRNGRGYAPDRWTDSTTFRLRNQENLLVHDNVTREFEAEPFPAKQRLARRAWGNVFDGSHSRA